MPLYLSRIKITKSSLPTSWYDTNFINKEFNVIEEFNDCVEVAVPTETTKDIQFYILKGDYIEVGNPKGRRSNDYGYPFNGIACISKKIRNGKNGKRPWNFLKYLKIFDFKNKQEA